MFLNFTRRTTLGLVAFMLAGNVMAIEHLGYQVIATHKNIEVRRYQAYLSANVVVSDEFEDAGKRAFRDLFNYIGGSNSASVDISMTAPVIQTKADAGWDVSFVMPHSLTAETLPQPLSESVRLKANPEQLAAVLVYSGTWSEKRYRLKEAELRSGMQTAGLVACGEPLWARHDAPFTPWFMRTNEILIPICTAG